MFKILLLESNHSTHGLISIVTVSTILLRVYKELYVTTGSLTSTWKTPVVHSSKQPWINSVSYTHLTLPTKRIV